MDWNEVYNLGLGLFEKATAFVDEALEMKPDAQACCVLGDTLGNLGRWEEAIACYDKALEIKPNYHEAWFNRGVAMGNLGLFEKARSSCLLYTSDAADE